MPTHDSMRERSVGYHKNACGNQRSKSKTSLGYDARTRVEDGDHDISWSIERAGEDLKLGPSYSSLNLENHCSATRTNQVISTSSYLLPIPQRPRLTNVP